MAGENPIDWRPDGSIAFDVDGVKIRWRPPKMKHKEAHHNRYYAIAEEARDRLAEKRKDLVDALAESSGQPEISDVEAISQKDQLTEDLENWVRAVHDDLRLEGDLPELEEWPGWLPVLRFAGAVTRHWGSAPFG